MRRADESYLATCLVMRLYPFKIFLACICPRKGYDPDVVRMVSKFIKDMGLVHFAYKCDREISLNSMIEEAISKTGRTGKRVHHDDPGDDPDNHVVEDDEPDAPTNTPKIPTPPFTTIAVPELTQPGESASNGLAERG